MMLSFSAWWKNTFIGICVNVEKIGKLASGFVTVPQVMRSSCQRWAEARVGELIRGSTSATEAKTRHVLWLMIPKSTLSHRYWFNNNNWKQNTIGCTYKTSRHTLYSIFLMRFWLDVFKILCDIVTNHFFKKRNPINKLTRPEFLANTVLKG